MLAQRILKLILHFSAIQSFVQNDTCTITTFNEVSQVIKHCDNIIIDNLKVPGGSSLVLDLNSGTTVTFRGNTSFGYAEWDGPLVQINGSNIVVKGEKGSFLDGQGPLWWDGLGTWGNVTKPRFLKISVQNAIMEDINLMHCPILCVNTKSSENLTIRNWKIDNLDGDQGVAPTNKYGHNTDGFDVTGNNILIENSFIYNQDDCVAITSGSNITVRNLFCHGSHGLSISGKASVLDNVLIADSIVTAASNGIHIKTHVETGQGLIRNVTYRNITLLDCKSYGISIQQNYRNLPANESQDGPPENNIPIRNLQMINIFGNVLGGAIPVYILCAEEGCFDWQWDGVKIYGTGSDNCTNFVPEGYDC